MSTVHELRQVHERVQEARTKFGDGSLEYEAMVTQRDAAIVNADLGGLAHDEIAAAIELSPEEVERILRPQA